MDPVQGHGLCHNCLLIRDRFRVMNGSLSGVHLNGTFRMQFFLMLGVPVSKRRFSLYAARVDCYFYTAFPCSRMVN